MQVITWYTLSADSEFTLLPDRMVWFFISHGSLMELWFRSSSSRPSRIFRVLVAFSVMGLPLLVMITSSASVTPSAL